MTDPRIRARRIEVKRDLGRRRLRIVHGLAVSIAIGVSGLLIVHSPLFEVAHVTVVGDAHVGLGDLLATGGIKGHPPLIDVDPGAVSTRLESLPWVANAVVDRSWPSGLRITLTDRLPVAIVSAQDPPTHVEIALVDATGRVLQLMTVPAARLEAEVAAIGLPVVAGVGRPGPPGSSLGAKADTAALRVAENLPESLVAHVATIVAGNGGVDVHLASGTVALFGDPTAPADLHESFAALATLLSRVDLSGIKTIDLRLPSAPVLTP